MTHPPQSPQPIVGPGTPSQSPQPLDSADRSFQDHASLIHPETVMSFMKRLDENISLLLERVAATAPGLMTVKDAARFLGIGERTIRAKLATREWPDYRCGAAVRVDPLELKARMKRVPGSRKAGRSSPRSGSFPSSALSAPSRPGTPRNDSPGGPRVPAPAASPPPPVVMPVS